MSVVPPPMSIRTTPSSFSSAVSTASAEAIGCRIRSDTSRPQRRTHLTMFCTADTAPVTMCTRTSRRMPLMPIGSRTSSWLVDDEFLRHRVQQLLVGRDVDGLGRFDHARHVGRGDFLVLDRDHAARIERADMAAGDAGIDVADLAVGHQLGFFERALDRFDGGLDVDDDALLQALRLVLTESDDLVASVGHHLGHHRHHLGGADVESDDQIFRVFCHFAWPTVCSGLCCWLFSFFVLQPSQALLYPSGTCSPCADSARPFWYRMSTVAMPVLQQAGQLRVDPHQPLHPRLQRRRVLLPAQRHLHAVI